MLIQGQVGQPTISSIQAGSTPAIRQGQLGDVIVSELHGRYYESTYRRNMYTAILNAGTTTSAGLATTFTGLLLYNPQNSTVNVAINKVGFNFLVAFGAAAAVGLMTGTAPTNPGTSTTNTTVRPNFVGLPNGSGQALAYSTATLTATGATPILHSVFGVGLTGAITTVPLVPGMFFDYEGSLILPPGTYVATYTSTASGTSSTFASIQYEEIPV